MDELESIKNQVVEFRDSVKKYRKLLMDSRDSVLPEIARNFDEIEQMRSDLIMVYARLEKYIEKIGNNPKMNDGVWNIWYSPYSNAFTKDVLPRIGKSADLIITDLDYIIGKLSAMSNEAFDGLFIEKTERNNSDISENPHKEYWGTLSRRFLIFAWRLVKNLTFQIIVGVFVVLIGGYFLFKLGWN